MNDQSTITLELHPVKFGEKIIWMRVTPWVANQLDIMQNSVPARLNGLGVVTPVAVTAALRAGIAITNKLLTELGIGYGRSGGVTQTKTGEVVQVIGDTATALGTALTSIISVCLAAGVSASSIPVAGWIISAVLVIIAGICSLIDSIWGTDPDLAIWSVAQDYYKINARLRFQVIEITNHIENLLDSFNQLRTAFAETGLLVPQEIARPASLGGLGSSAQTVLDNEIANVKILLDEREKRIKVVIDLMRQVTLSIKQTIDAINGKDDAQRIMMYSLFGISGLGFLYYFLTSNQNDKN